MNVDALSSKNNHDQQDLCASCLRNPHYLVFHKKMVSRLVALLLITAFSVFVVGFFLGKKQLAEDFGHHVEHANFSDQINFALSSLYDKEQPQKNNEHESMTSYEQSEDLIDKPTNTIVAATPETSVKIDQSVSQPQSKSTVKYAAQLLGGKRKDITEFAQRLNKHGITIEIRERVSKSARGKTVQWYQAVTPQFENESDLQTLVAKIQKLEKINNIQIIPISV